MELIIDKAPSIIGLFPKSVYTPSAEAFTIRQAMTLALSACPSPVPVYHGRKHLGYVARAPGPRPRVVWSPGSYEFASYDSFVAAISAGQKINSYFAKSNTTAPGANIPMDLWPVAGFPEPGAYTGAAFTSRAFDNTTKGALTIGANVSPKIRQLAGWFSTATDVTNSASPPVMLILYDRLLTYEACTFTNGATQNMTNSTPMPRYNGAGLPGAQLFIEGQTVFGAAQPTITQWVYIDQDGNTQTINLAGNFVYRFFASVAAPTNTLGASMAGAPLGNALGNCGVFMSLATGDGSTHIGSSGIRSITSYTQSAVVNTGTFCFALVKPLAYLGSFSTSPFTATMDYIQQQTTMPRIYDGACLSFIASFISAHSYQLDGHITMLWS